MKDIPIIFSGPMVRALLGGRKTMTRRLAWRFSDVNDNHTKEPTSWQKVKPGDRLWVRESLAQHGHFGFPLGPVPQIDDHQGRVWSYMADAISNRTGGRPSIHMPRWASRLTLAVTAVKIERPQDISEVDAAAEGIARSFTEHECKTVVGLIGTKPEDHGWNNYLWHGHHGKAGLGDRKSDAWPYQYSTYKDARGSFSSLWAWLNGPDSWDENPEVVALTFTVHKQNIDAMSKANAA